MALKILALLVCPYALFAAAGEASAPATDADNALARAANEFKVQTETLGIRPEQTGANQVVHGPKLVWHGRLFEDFRNDVLDAIPHEIKQGGQQKALLRRNQFGFNVSGPVVIPRVLSATKNTFFSLSYEGVRERISRTHLQTVPTLRERTGDFSQTVDQAGNPLPIYDPETTRANPLYNDAEPVSAANPQYLRDRFPGNRIPLNRLDPVAVRAFSLYPDPNADVGPFSQNNFFVVSPETNVANGILAKIDRNFGDRHRLTFDSNISNGLLGSARWFQNMANPGSPDQKHQTHTGSIEHVFTFSPSTVNTAKFDASSTTSRGTTGYDQLFPVYQLYPYVGMGTALPRSRDAKNVFTISDGLSSRRGQHSISVSAEGVARQLNVLVPQYPAGVFNFSSGLTSLPGVIDTGNPIASFLLGLPDYAEQSIVTAPSYFRQHSGTLSAVDNYQVAKNFNLRIGVSASVHGARTEKYDRQSTVDAAAINPADERSGALVFAGRNGIGSSLAPTIVHFDPSLGLSWNPGGSSNTVIRASVARSHEQMPLYPTQWATQGFNARQTFLSPNGQLSPALLLDAGIPALPYPLPDIRPDAANGGAVDYMDRGRREPTYRSASLTLERQLPWSIVVAAGASFEDGKDLFVGNDAANPNAISPNALIYRDRLNDQAFSASLRPFPQYTTFDLNDCYPIGRYQRDAFSLRVEKHSSNGLSVRALYDWGKQFDDYSGPYGIQDLFNRRNDWALNAYTPPQYLRLNYVYELPIGTNKPFLNFSDWRGALFNGWSISGTAYLDDGTPLALHPEFNNTGGVIMGLTVDSVPGVNPNVRDPGPNRWFNPAAFDQPADFTLGTASRTSSTLLNPGNHNLDLSVVKRIGLGADRSMEMTATAFNFINHADWNNPDTTIGPASAPNVDAGRILGSHGGRVVQLALTVNF